jgi:plasmid stabilization system protein ParE
MGGRVIWKPKALKQMRGIERYLKEEFGKTILYKFLDDLDEVLERLKKYPETGHLTIVRGVRRIKVYKKTSLFYRVQQDNIVVHRVSDDREDPKKNPLK